jgi:hypothetical protein
MTNQLVPGRECGDCNVCCRIFAIDKPEIQKQPGALCRHCANGPCEIYQTRPDVCRTYYCGWRRLEILEEDWRPDKSGILVELGDSDTPSPTSPALVLVLIGNPLKTVRQQRFIEFVATSIRRNTPLFLSVPGPVGKQAARLALNSPEVVAAVRQSRSHVRIELEKALKRFSAHEYLPYPATYSGNDVST